MSSVKRLVIEYWKSPSDIRNTEVLNCIESNIKSNLFDEIWIISEDKDLKINGAIIVKSDIRVTFQTVIDFINTLTKETDINIISNSDIQFDESLNLIKNIKTNDYVCLTRYENNKIIYNNNKPSEISQDVWCFRGTIRIQNAYFYFGEPGCDNTFSYLANSAGYDLKNWSLDIQTHHKHESNIRIGNSKKENYPRTMLPMKYYKHVAPLKIS